VASIRLRGLPVDDESLWWTVRVLFGVTIPRTRVCPDHVAPFTAFADAYFGRNSLLPGSPRSGMGIWHASRGLAGKSKTLSVLGLILAYLKGADITILGGSMAQSVNVHDYMRAAMEREALQGMVLDQTSTKISLTNKGRVRPLTASQRTVRGPHPSILLMDEVDEMELAIYDAALGQPMPQPNYLGETVATYTVVSSTWQNPEGTFTEILRRAEERDTQVYQWCYRESSNSVDGWLTEQTIQDKRDSVSAEMFRIEYDLGEPAIGNRAFDGAAVERAFSLKFNPTEPLGTGTGWLSEKTSKDFEEYTFAEPLRHGTYVACADWGKEADKTVIWVARVDQPQRELVYYLRVNRRPYPQMIGWYNAVINRYDVPDTGAWHDSTGLGNVVNDYLDVRAHAFSMTGDKRTKLLSDYVNAIEKGAWKIPKIKSAYIEMKYCRYGDLYSNKMEYHLPDSVCAGALAEYAARRAAPGTGPLLIKRDDRPTKLASMFVADEQDPARSPISAEDPEPGFSFIA
jgi:hypothetical protein